MLDRAGDAMTASLIGGVNHSLLELCNQAYDLTLGNGSDGAACDEAFSSIPRLVLENQHHYGVCPGVDLQEPARLRDQLHVFDNERRKLQQSLEKSETSQQELERLAQDLQSQLDAFRSSTSWRMTSPLRSIVRWLKFE